MSAPVLRAAGFVLLLLLLLLPATMSSTARPSSPPHLATHPSSSSSSSGAPPPTPIITSVSSPFCVISRDGLSLLNCTSLPFNLSGHLINALPLTIHGRHFGLSGAAVFLNGNDYTRTSRQVSDEEVTASIPLPWWDTFQVFVQTVDRSVPRSSTQAWISFTLCRGGRRPAPVNSTFPLLNSSLPHAGLVQCVACPPGSFSGGFSDTTCHACPPHTFSTPLTAYTCQQCPSNLFAPNASSTRCFDCTVRPDMEECRVDSLLTPILLIAVTLSAALTLLATVLVQRARMRKRMNGGTPASPSLTANTVSLVPQGLDLDESLLPEADAMCGEEG